MMIKRRDGRSLKQEGAYSRCASLRTALLTAVAVWTDATSTISQDYHRDTLTYSLIIGYARQRELIKL